ncbi:HAD family hydrolase [Kitasatospora camelliae]|uniref:HAD family hydrolase n=1 Tax=Kitasatospora camelliae TaxID=3156397 RepID=A0AAU8JV11_9ACTN
MPLLLFDLDNTLLPRDAAFRAWARDFLAEYRLPAGDLEWFSTIDGGGYVPRDTVLGAAKRRYGLDHSLDLLLAHYRRGVNSHIHCPDSHVKALRAARNSGWTLGIVSNGGTRPQLEKIRRTGLGSLVDGWVISEEAACLKPDPLIFEIAARRCGYSPTRDWTSHTWMIGDHAPADIAGAEATGLRSVWLHHGRPWAERGYRPTLSAPGLPEAVGLVLSARSAATPASAMAARAARATAAAGAARGAGVRVGAELRVGAGRPVAVEAVTAPLAAQLAGGRDTAAATGTGGAGGTFGTADGPGAAQPARPRTRVAVPASALAPTADRPAPVGRVRASG